MGEDLIAGKDAIAVDRIDLAQPRSSPRLLCSDQGGAGTAEEVEHDVIASRDILDGIRDHLHRLDRRMQLQLVHPSRLQRVDPTILPDIGPVATMLAQFERIDVRCGPFLPGKDQFVAGAVEGAHAAIVLGPDDEVLQFVVDGMSSRKYLAHVPPVHAEEVDRAIKAMVSHVPEAVVQEGDELISGHLAGRHGELAVLHLAGTTDMTVDRNVIRWIGEDHSGLLALHQGCDHLRIERIAADEAMRTKPPDVSRPTAGRYIGVIRQEIVGRVAILLVCLLGQNGVDLWNGEAAQRNIETALFSLAQQGGQLLRQKIAVPACVERQLVVGEDIGALLRCRHVIEADARHLGLAKQLGRFDPAMAGKDRSGLIDQHRIGKAEFGNAVGDLPDLLLRMGPGVTQNPAGSPSGGGLDLLAWPKLDFERFGEVERVPLSRIARLSGPNLARNATIIPHVTNFEEADITELEELRKQLNAESKNASRLSILPFVVKAAAATLKEHPKFNSSLDGDALIIKKYYNIGVAADTPEGLVVPVVKAADQKGIREIADEMAELAASARAGKLKPQDMQGATFTISSLGGIGGTNFTPIINAPEVAILGMTRAAIRPSWDGVAFQPRLVQPLSLSWDHRAVDGVAAAHFLVTLKKLLSDFRRISL